MEGPQHVDLTNRSQFVRVHPDRCTVTYTGRASTQNDYGVVRTDRPVPRESYLYHYEVVLQNCCSGSAPSLQIGFSAEHFNM